LARRTDRLTPICNRNSEQIEVDQELAALARQTDRDHRVHPDADFTTFPTEASQVIIRHSDLLPGEQQ
jgi:hypothetical protein